VQSYEKKVSATRVQACFLGFQIQFKGQDDRISAFFAIFKPHFVQMLPYARATINPAASVASSPSTMTSRSTTASRHQNIVNSNHRSQREVNRHQNVWFWLAKYMVLPTKTIYFALSELMKMP
jgi:hypothetical protein